MPEPSTARLSAAAPRTYAFAAGASEAANLDRGDVEANGLPLLAQEQRARFLRSRPHADGDGPIKTFTLRGLKDSPPYLHDGRLLTIEDVIEFFNVVLQTRLNADEKRALRAFLLAL
jgi:cytochrome c peroxidase